MTTQPKHPTSRDDVAIWPDGEWCFRSELEETLQYSSDDFAMYSIDSIGTDDIDQFAYNVTSIVGR